MVKSGEQTGKLGEALDLITDQMEKEEHLRKQVKSAMIYPSIKSLAALVITSTTGIALHSLSSNESLGPHTSHALGWA